MAHLTYPRPRRRHLPYWLVAASMAAAFAAILPIVAGIFGGAGGNSVPRAFAAAPPGLMVVGVRADEREDVILVAPVNALQDVREVARVVRLPGYISSGAVSPDGTQVALVVADGGTPTRPLASLVVVTLASGDLRRAASGIDQLQSPLWAPDSSLLLVTRSSEGGPLVDVTLLAVDPAGGGETPYTTFEQVLGAYPVGFDAQGRAAVVTIDGEGSTLLRPGAEPILLGPGITRDWRLSPDRARLAYVETSLAGGLSYHRAVVNLDGPQPVERAQSADGEQLGAAWHPGGQVAFGGARITAGRDQSSGRGFDIPLGFSPMGDFVAVQSWDGPSLHDPGEMRLEVVALAGGRAPMSLTRFYGWASR